MEKVEARHAAAITALHGNIHQLPFAPDGPLLAGLEGAIGDRTMVTGHGPTPSLRRVETRQAVVSDGDTEVRDRCACVASSSNCFFVALVLQNKSTCLAANTGFVVLSGPGCVKGSLSVTHLLRC
jgi:hypothetical protein